MIRDWLRVGLGTLPPENWRLGIEEKDEIDVIWRHSRLVGQLTVDLSEFPSTRQGFGAEKKNSGVLRVYD